MGGHEIRPNHMKVKATRFRQDAECGGSNPAALASQSGLHWATCEGPSKRRGTAAFRRYRAVSVWGIGLQKCHSAPWSPRPLFGVSFLRTAGPRTGFHYLPRRACGVGEETLACDAAGGGVASQARSAEPPVFPDCITEKRRSLKIYGQLKRQGSAHLSTRA